MAHVGCMSDTSCVDTVRSAVRMADGGETIHAQGAHGEDSIFFRWNELLFRLTPTEADPPLVDWLDRSTWRRSGMSAESLADLGEELSPEQAAAFGNTTSKSVSGD